MAAMPNSRALAVDRRLAPSVDTPSAASLSFAPPEPTAPLPNAHPSPPRPPIAVVSSRALPASAIGRGGPIGAMSDYPVQLEKVQPPPLREDILARNRLLDWLAVKVHNRVVLVTAEAGYGKTTLLADFARRSRVLVLWYRLDRGDRDWAGFIAHLVAAVRRHAPSFGALTTSLIRETGASAPPLESVLDTFIRELTDLPPEPAALVLDDFHLVEDAADIRDIVRQLLERAPERLTFIFASRRTPPVRLARLRSLGEVAEIVTDDLRFDHDETQRLFRDAYSMTIEPTLVTELSRRTEGWAASLHLVRTALHDRDASQVRAFIRSLTGAEGHLYDYLAEEVVGDLPDELQTFLMRTSLLDRVDLVLAPVAAGLSPDETHRLIDEAERVGLFGRQPGPIRAARAHPLVRDFLQVRLARSITADELQQLHRSIAAAAEPVDWRVAVHHYIAGGLHVAARRVLSASVESILATGAYSAAEEAARALEEGVQTGSVGVEIVGSRVALRAGDLVLALQKARAAAELEPSSDIAIWNAAMVMLSVGALDEMAEYASRLLTMDTVPFRRLSAAAIVAGVDSSVRGDLGHAEALFLATVEIASRAGHVHFVGVAFVNAALIRRAAGDAPVALDYAERAISALSQTSSGIELVSANLLRAWALAHMGRMDEARLDIEALAASPVRTLEFASEAADIEALYGDVRRAVALLRPFEHQLDPGTDMGEQALMTAASMELVLGHLEKASASIAQLARGRKSSNPGVEARRQIIDGLCALLMGDPTATTRLEQAAKQADAQGAHLWSRVAWTAIGSALSSDSRSLLDFEPAYLSMAAEAVVRHLPPTGEVLEAIEAEAKRRPDRWRSPLRMRLAVGDSGAEPAARLLEEIGESDDVAPLRAFARRRHGGASALGRRLARRIAPHVWVGDLGNVELEVGDRHVPGTEVRRKVLALLTFLVTRPSFRAQREEVLDALWPDVEPESALNSLNQTVYFLRRVFEPNYVEDLSPGYVGQTTDSIWLDTELVAAESRTVRSSIREAVDSGLPHKAKRAVALYRGAFATDFLYEEWSARYRESLHASYLQLVEGSLRANIERGDFNDGIEIAQLAAELEPESDGIQVALVRLYRLAGAHAAAAEQYGRYVAVMRDLGLDAAPLDELLEA